MRRKRIALASEELDQRRVAAHQVHRRLGGVAAGQLQRIEVAVAFEEARDGEAVVEREPALEAVVHVELGPDRDRAAGGGADRVHDLAREAGAVLDRAPEAVTAAVVVGREELAEQVAVADVHLEPVEPGVDGEARRGRELPLDLRQVVLRHRAREALGVQAERPRRSERLRPRRLRVGEPSRVAELDRRLRALGVHRVGEATQARARPPDASRSDRERCDPRRRPSNTRASSWRRRRRRARGASRSARR